MSDDKAQPLLQRILENPLLMLALGLLVMFVFYTGWGLVEILTLKESPLP